VRIVNRPYSVEEIASLIHRLPPVRFIPAAYFLADCGVITLVWTGFPTPVIDLQEKLGIQFPFLPPETRGSTWSKTTLAFRASSEPLSLDEVVNLGDILDHASEMLLSEVRCLAVEEFSLIVYGDRALQHRFSKANLPVNQEDSPQFEISPASAAYVTTLLNASTEERLSGTTRTAHDLKYYTRPCHESTLAVDVDTWSHPSLDFLRSRIDDQMPDRYHWIPTEARHITVRNLGPAESSDSN